MNQTESRIQDPMECPGLDNIYHPKQEIKQGIQAKLTIQDAAATPKQLFNKINMEQAQRQARTTYYSLE